jgi:hypothetical protein
MKYKPGFFIRLAIGFLFVSPIALFAGPVSLEPGEIVQLKALVSTNAGAAALFAKVQQATDRELSEKPNPIARVVSEGHLEKDPAKIRTEASLADMDKIESLGWAWAVTGRNDYLAKTREYIMAWATVNQADGDAINESKFEPVIVAYDLTRSQFPPADQAVVDAWLRSKANALARELTGFGGNWPCHRLKIVGLVGLTIGDRSLADKAMSGFRKQVAKDIHPNGACNDFYVRDALHYQLYSVDPLLTLARAGERHGEHLFDYKGPDGASLHTAVNFVVPFADGQEKHIEFAHSKSKADSRRGNNGESEYQPHLWDPSYSIYTFAKAAWFDPAYGKLAARLAGQPNETYVNWSMVVDAVSRPSR